MTYSPLNGVYWKVLESEFWSGKTTFEVSKSLDVRRQKMHQETLPEDCLSLRT